MTIMFAFVMALAWITTMGYVWALRNRLDQLERDFSVIEIGYDASLKLINAETERKLEHNRALKQLTDPEAIADEMEKGARVREMYDANRTTLPREDAGPPARVYTPSMRAKVNKSGWKRKEN